MKNLRWIAVVVFSLSTMLNYLDRQLLAGVQPSVLAQFKIDNAQYGQLLAAFSIVYGLSAPIMGWMLDRFGLTLVATIAVGLWSLASVMTGFSGSFTELLIWRGVLGLAESVAIPATGKAYAFLLPPRERSIGTAVNQIGLTVGSVAATLLAGWAAPRFGWQSTFWIAGPLGWLWIPLWLAMSRRVELRSQAVLPDAAAASLAMLKDARLWALIGTILMTMPLYSLWSNWTTAYLVHECGLTEAQANLGFAWIPQIFATLGGLFGGWATYRLAPRTGVQTARFRVCLFAALAVLVSTAALPFLTSTPVVTFGISMSLFFTLTISVNTYAMPLDLYGPARAGFAIAMLTCIYGFMSAAISPQIGHAVDHNDFRMVCFIGAVCPMLGVLILWSQRLHRDSTA